MDLPPAPNVAGFSLAGTVPYVITVDENRLLCAATHIAPDPTGLAHPIYFFVATQVAMGQTVAGLCKVCGFDVEDGPMMGGSQVNFSGQIHTATPYMVAGKIVALTRKRSRKFGVMDVLDYELQLMAQDGTSVLSTRNTWMLPRPALGGQS